MAQTASPDKFRWTLPRTPFAIEAPRRHAAAMPFHAESAVDPIHRLRNEERC